MLSSMTNEKCSVGMASRGGSNDVDFLHEEAIFSWRETSLTRNKTSLAVDVVL